MALCWSQAVDGPAAQEARVVLGDLLWEELLAKGRIWTVEGLLVYLARHRFGD